MERLTTDTPKTNMEVLANFAYAKDKEVHLIYGDGLEGVSLADYIVDHAKSDFGCSVTTEDVINGDSCWECDCPLAILNATATQAAELRSRLKKYEDAEEQGQLVLLPCKPGDMVWRICGLRGRKDVAERRVESIEYTVSGEIWIHSTASDVLGKTVFLTREEAEAALKGENNA